jgi:hypothetical protein
VGPALCAIIHSQAGGGITGILRAIQPRSLPHGDVPSRVVSALVTAGQFSFLFGIPALFCGRNAPSHHAPAPEARNEVAQGVSPG